MQQTLYTRQNSRYIIGRIPSVLKNVKTKLAVGVDVGVEHPRQEFDGGRLVRIGFVACSEKLESAIFKKGIAWTKDNGVPEHDVVR